MPPAILAVAGAAGAVGVSSVFGMSLAAAVGVVGTGMSVVGMVTGNKNMMKVGGLMGLAGGAMGLAGIGTDVIGAGAAATQGGASAAESIAANTADLQSMWGDAELMAAAKVDSVIDTVAAGSGDAIASSVSQPYTDTLTPTDFNRGISPPASADGATYSNTAPVNSFGQPPDMGQQPSGLLNQSPKMPQITGEPAPVDAFNANSTPLGEMPKTDFNHGEFSASFADLPKPGPMQSIKDFWNGLKPETQQTLLKAGLQGGAQLFAGWTQQQQAEFQQNYMKQQQANQKQQQANQNAQPVFERYRPKGLLSQGQG